MSNRKHLFSVAMEIFAALGLFAAAYHIFYAMTIRVGSDISIHAVWASEGNFSELDSFFHHCAHPMWHVLVAIAMRLGLPLDNASALVTALCKAVQLPLCVWVMDKAMPGKLNRLTRVLLSVCCMLVSSLRVSIYNPTVYLQAGTPNCWHSCTQTIALSWMLLCVPVVASRYDTFTDKLREGNRNPVLSWKKQILMGAILMLSLFAKPTFMQTFLPAACVFFLIQWIRHPASLRYFLQTLVCVLPAILMMILQYMYYFGIIVPSQGNMVLQLSWQKVLDTIIKAALLLAFPVYTALITLRMPKNTLYKLTLIMNAVAVIEFLLLGEDGRRAQDGNFGWGMMGAALMAWAVLLPRFFTDMKEKFCFVHVPGILLLLWHFGSGIYYIVYLMSGNALL